MSTEYDPKIFEAITLSELNEKYGDDFDLNVSDEQGNTPIHYAAKSNPDPNIIKKLVTLNTDINFIDKSGNSALMTAIFFNKNIEIALDLLKYGINPNTKNKLGYTPLMLSARYKNESELLNTLINCGANINEVDNKGFSALAIAAKYNNSPEIIDILVKLGSKINKKDKLGRTPLMNAVLSKKIQNTKKLIECGADIESTDKDGNTSLILASNLNDLETINLLVENGAFLKRKNKKGETALIVANKHNYYKTSSVLQNFENKIPQKYEYLDTLLFDQYNFDEAQKYYEENKAFISIKSYKNKYEEAKNYYEQEQQIEILNQKKKRLKEVSDHLKYLLEMDELERADKYYTANLQLLNDLNFDYINFKHHYFAKKELLELKKSLEKFNFNKADKLFSLCQYLDKETYLKIYKKYKQQYDKLREEQTKINKEIKSYAEQREIQYLIHFTRIDNITNILKYGLKCLDDLRNSDIDFIETDGQRIDNDFHSICCSIGFPNYKMFYKKTREISKENWAILILNPSILWEKKCTFYEDNAATSRYSGGGNSVDDLKQMFESKKQHRNSNIPAYFPSNPQAEVHIHETISYKYIQQIETNSYNYDIENLAKKHNIKYKNNNYFFEKRLDFKDWPSSYSTSIKNQDTYDYEPEKKDFVDKIFDFIDSIFK